MSELSPRVEAASAAVDLSAYVPKEQVVLQMLIPGTGKPIGWSITMAGPSHPKTVALMNESSRKYLHKEALIEAARINGRKWKGGTTDPTDNRREFIEGLVARIVTWSPVRLDKEYPFSEPAAIELLLKPEMGPYVAQIVEFLVDEKSFMAGSASA